MRQLFFLRAWVLAGLVLSVWARPEQKRATTISQAQPLSAGANLLAPDPRLTKILEKLGPGPPREFKVGGLTFPDVNFNIGESFSGLLPISNDPAETQNLFFWYFPSTDLDAVDEITVWLSGGPGCSSLEAVLQGNGPISWPAGNFHPQQNPYSWTNLTNMLWVEQPIGTGFSQGGSPPTSEADVATQFVGFFENFLSRFAFTNKKVYLTGEGFAGNYIPSIADAMRNNANASLYTLAGSMLFSPMISTTVLQQDVPAASFVQANQALLGLNQTFVDSVNRLAATCGFSAFLNASLTFPPQPLPPPPSPPPTTDCGSLWQTIVDAATLINPCFDPSHITRSCPPEDDVLDRGLNGTSYFNRTDVKTALHVPTSLNWQRCSPSSLNTNDPASFPALSHFLQSLIEHANRTILVASSFSLAVPAQGLLASIQSLRFNGATGFTAKPADPFVVPALTSAMRKPGGTRPLRTGPPATQDAGGSGVMGQTRTERGLTWVELGGIGAGSGGAGVVGGNPAASYRLLEVLLGRVGSLSGGEPFSR